MWPGTHPPPRASRTNLLQTDEIIGRWCATRASVASRSTSATANRSIDSASLSSLTVPTSNSRRSRPTPIRRSLIVTPPGTRPASFPHIRTSHQPGLPHATSPIFLKPAFWSAATAAIRTARPSIPTADLADAQQSLAMPVGTYLPSTHGRSFRRGPLRLSTDVMLISRACLTPFCMFFVKPAVRSAATAAIRSAGASIQPADFADAEQTLAMPVGSIHPPFMVIPPDLAQSASLKTTFRPCRCCHTIASGHTRSRYVRVI